MVEEMGTDHVLDVHGWALCVSSTLIVIANRRMRVRFRLAIVI